MSVPVQPPPLYARLQHSLRDDIRTGRLPPGALLPSERDMEVQHGVSRITVRRALDELAREGLLERSRGRLARVLPSLTAAVRTRIEDDLASSLQLGRGMEAEVLSYRWRLPDPAVAAILDTPTDEPVLHVERLRRRNGQGVLHTLAHVPSAVGILLPRDALADATMLDLLAARGIVASSARQDMRAGACPSDVSRWLEIASGAPVFVIDRLVRDTAGRPMQHLIATFRGDSFTYRISSEQQGSGAFVEVQAAGRVVGP